jgi:hypothetical protein
VEGDYKIVGGPGLQTLNYTDTQAGRKYTGQTIEIRGAAACGTLTFTPTNTPPPTDTYTFTPTATYTPTRTITPSPTYTNTFSPTAIIFTLTNTPTPSGTPTYTATRTTTPTASITYTYTNTPTPSATLTPSPTPSVTYTATPTPTYTATPTASPTASITYTMTITPTFSGTPTDTPSATLTNTPTLSPTFTFTRTITDTYTWTPTFSITSTFSPSPTITETPVPMPIGIHIVIYNSGGEVVRHLFQGFSPLALNHPALSVPAFVLGRGKVEVKVGDGNSSAVLTTWDGTGDLGQPVAAGEYYVKIESNDNYSRTTSVILSVGVFPKQTQNWLRVFTSSGEMVADLSFMLKLAPDVNLEEMSLESTTFAEAYDPATGNALAPLYIHLRDNKGGTQTVPWNGYNQAGRPVDTGWYYLQACSNKDTGQVLINRQVEVIKAKGEDLGAEVYAAPNPAGMAALGSVQTQVSVYYKPVALWGVARVKLYDLSGQVVGGGQDGQGTGRVDVEISSLASGVYLADFEYQDSAGQVRRKVLKLAIVK